MNSPAADPITVHVLRDKVDRTGNLKHDVIELKIIRKAGTVSTGSSRYTEFHKSEERHDIETAQLSIGAPRISEAEANGASEEKQLVEAETSEGVELVTSEVNCCYNHSPARPARHPRGSVQLTDVPLQVSQWHSVCGVSFQLNLAASSTPPPGGAAAANHRPPYYGTMVAHRTASSSSLASCDSVQPHWRLSG
eukprot:757407-Hanusia_phi.AAC.4